MSATAKAFVHYELKCDGCGNVYEDGEGQLYAEAGDVREVAQLELEWQQQPDGRDLCRVCGWTDTAVAEREAADDE